MKIEEKSPSAIAEQLGSRLKQARLNADLTQADVAEQAGISRKMVMAAEKGKAQLETLIAIMLVLDLASQLNHFIPQQNISPIQLAKLQGKQRQRASGTKSSDPEETSQW
ncbi:helix-turn-helix transcriptional regulator [Neptunicella sp.]|uniref:helix-turn-helix transcriptional regulator n=1 Tax=Neptunicella sp. TaxID=2125986 RepID=UPI003F691FDA